MKHFTITRRVELRNCVQMSSTSLKDELLYQERKTMFAAVKEFFDPISTIEPSKLKSIAYELIEDGYSICLGLFALSYAGLVELPKNGDSICFKLQIRAHYSVDENFMKSMTFDVHEPSNSITMSVMNKNE